MTTVSATSETLSKDQKAPFCINRMKRMAIISPLRADRIRATSMAIPMVP